VRKDLTSIASVFSGTAGAQLIGLACTPLLTRLFLPEAFGHVGVFLALAGVLMPIAALTLPMAIVLTKEKLEAQALSKLSIVIALLISMIAYLFIIVNFDWLLVLLKAEGEGKYLYWLPTIIFFSALLQINENWVIKLSFFKLKAKVSVIHALIVNLLKVIAGLLYPSGIMLIIIAVINPFLNALLLFLPSRKNIMSGNSSDSDIECRWQSLMSKYREFPIFQAPQALLNAISQGGPVIILATTFGPVSAGYYAFSRSILAIPIMLLGKAMGDVFYARVAKQINDQQLQQAKNLLVQSTLLLAFIGLFPLLIIVFWGPELFALIFGENWYQAGVYSQWLSLWTFFILINAPSLKMIIVLKKQKVSFLINCISTPVRIAILVIGGAYFNDVRLTILMFVGASVLHNVIIIAVAYIACNNMNKELKAII
jgi:O-antigen/teichoic acid export membrane protein